jgi:hypothetical protein
MNGGDRLFVGYNHGRCTLKAMPIEPASWHHEEAGDGGSPPLLERLVSTGIFYFEGGLMSFRASPPPVR